MFQSSTTFIPAQYLRQIQADQHEVRAEANRFASVARRRPDAKFRGRDRQRTASGVFGRLRTAIARG